MVIPMDERSLQFAPRMFDHMVNTRDVQGCRADARKARALAETSPGGRFLCLARAAWWEAVADRIAARAAERADA